MKQFPTMLLTEFNTLQLNKKSDLVWEWGHYLTSRKHKGHNIALFIMHYFFAEVHISLINNKTTEIKGIAKDALHPDFVNALNHDDPFVKVFLGDRSSSRPET
ncbi:MAG: hypothetical protein ACXVNM_05560, partial [Bacteroidia bacterium]